MILSVSYNTDLLALENILPLVRRWIHFACKKNGKLIIIPTIDKIDMRKKLILYFILFLIITKKTEKSITKDTKTLKLI